jgi:hypothetical protein
LRLSRSLTLRKENIFFGIRMLMRIFGLKEAQITRIIEKMAYVIRTLEYTCLPNTE